MSALQSNETPSNVPDWPDDLVRQYVQHLNELNHVLRLSMQGIYLITRTPNTLKALTEIEAISGHITNTKRISLGEAEFDAKLAQTEVDNDFPILHAQAVSLLWTGLEVFVRDILIKMLTNEPKTMSAPAIQKLKVTLGDYEALEKDEKYSYILDMLERELQIPFKQGIGKFETLLGTFNLSGTFDETEKRNLYELNNIRNVIVHRNSIADRRIIAACPWLELKLGQQIFITHTMYKRYLKAADSYCSEIFCRLYEFYGYSIRESLDSQISSTQ